jgi:hypothetical protein
LRIGPAGFLFKPQLRGDLYGQRKRQTEKRDQEAQESYEEGLQTLLSESRR